MSEKESLIVGLTGQTGAGKTTVAKVFADQGFAQIDADRISREVVEPGKPCLEELFDFFGDSIRNPDNTLNRKALAAIAFNDKKKLESLNSICHPFITEEIFERINRFTRNGQQFILLDAPTLFESRASDFCDLIISVIADPEIRCRRIMERDGLTEQEAQHRMNAQLPEEFFIKQSDHVIRNNDDLNKLCALSEEVADKIRTYYTQRYCK